MHALCHTMHHYIMRKLCTIMRVYALLCPVHNAQLYASAQWVHRAGCHALVARGRVGLLVLSAAAPLVCAA